MVQLDNYATRYCHRCGELVPIHEWRVEYLYEYDTIVHVGYIPYFRLPSCTDATYISDGVVCKYRERIPNKVN